MNETREIFPITAVSVRFTVLSEICNDAVHIHSPDLTEVKVRPITEHEGPEGE